MTWEDILRKNVTPLNPNTPKTGGALRPNTSQSQLSAKLQGEYNQKRRRETEQQLRDKEREQMATRRKKEAERRKIEQNEKAAADKAKQQMKPKSKEFYMNEEREKLRQMGYSQSSIEQEIQRKFPTSPPPPTQPTRRESISMQTQKVPENYTPLDLTKPKSDGLDRYMAITQQGQRKKQGTPQQKKTGIGIGF